MIRKLIQSQGMLDFSLTLCMLSFDSNFIQFHNAAFYLLSVDKATTTVSMYL